MNDAMERRSDRWAPAVRLALVVSLIAAAAAIVVSAASEIPQSAVVIPVIVVAFVASWVQSGRRPRPAVLAPVRRTIDETQRTPHTV